MYTTFTYWALIGFNNKGEQVWVEMTQRFRTTNEDIEIAEYADDLAEQERIGNVKYIAVCEHDNAA